MWTKLLRVGQYSSYLKRWWWQTAILSQLRRHGVQVDRTVTLYGTPIVSMSPDSRIVIESRCVLCSKSTYTALGVNHPVILRTLRPGASIRIGADSGISGATICAAVSVDIGQGVLLGANVTIVDTDFHPMTAHNRRYNNNPEDIASAAVIIGDNVFIGTGAVVLKGVHIGANTVIGAGSIVSGSIPSDVIAAGNPARVIKPLARS